jgi:hypothetical protein
MVPATLNSLVGRLGFGAPMVTPGKVNELFHTDWVCDGAPFAASTGWTPRLKLDAGLRKMFGGGAADDAC